MLTELAGVRVCTVKLQYSYGDAWHSYSSIFLESYVWSGSGFATRLGVLYILDWQGNFQANSASTYVPLRTPQTKSTVVLFCIFFFIFYLYFRKITKRINTHLGRETNQHKSNTNSKRKPCTYQCLPSPSSLLSTLIETAPAPIFTRLTAYQYPLTCAIRCLLISTLSATSEKKRQEKRKKKHLF